MKKLLIIPFLLLSLIGSAQTKWYVATTGSDTLAVTSLRVIMLGDATDTLSVDIFWDVNLNDGTPTELNTNPLPINSFTTGDEDTSFAAYKIPPDTWVWCETPGVVAGRKPTYMNAQISGYKIPRY